MMRSRERILAAMRLERVDRAPVSPWGFGHIDRTSPLGRELLAKTDMMVDTGVGGDPLLGRHAQYVTETLGDTTVTVLKTPKGSLTSRYRRTEVTGATVEHYLKSPEDIEKVLSIWYEPAEIDASNFFKLREFVGDEGLAMVGMVNGVAVPAMWFSPEDFCLAWADAPELIEKLTEVMTERLVDWVDALCEMGVDAFRVVGGEYASVQLGPEAFRRLCVKYDRELAAIMHKHGAVCHYHNHGPVMRYLEDFAEIGMDSIDPMEAPPWGDADLREARHRLGERVAFLGNLDDMEVINQLPTEEVLAIARERLEAAGDRGFMLGGTSSGTYGEHAARNFIAMGEMVDG